ncbi:MAG TPA: hypothetical protein VMB21_04055 [Candidatus Limnocylindria bacterium]|nr:hypothetical protein [Candidatus Limnocylindria bacterium]
MKQTVSNPLILLAAITALTAPALADYSNDFTSGTDADFTHYSPLQGFGAGGVYSFPGGGYSISAPASPLPGTLGPGRAASFLTAQNYGDFNVSYDILGYSAANAQFMGVFSRVSTPGLGTLNGYAMGLDTTTGQLFISRVQGEQSLGPIGVSAVSAALTLNPANAYSLSFSAVGSSFTGSLRDKLTGTLLATVSGTDSTYASGELGLGVAAQTFDAGALAQATFDNLSVSAVPEPAGWAFTAAGGLVAFAWLRRRSK